MGDTPKAHGAGLIKLSGFLEDPFGIELIKVVNQEKSHLEELFCFSFGMADVEAPSGPQVWFPSQELRYIETRLAAAQFACHSWWDRCHSCYAKEAASNQPLRRRKSHSWWLAQKCQQKPGRLCWIMLVSFRAALISKKRQGYASDMCEQLQSCTTKHLHLLNYFRQLPTKNILLYKESLWKFLAIASVKIFQASSRQPLKPASQHSA